MGCWQTNNTADPAYAQMEIELKDGWIQEITMSGDSRVVGPDKELFDSYIRYSPMHVFFNRTG